MFCPKCGTEVQDGQAFCPSCGNNLSSNGGSNQTIEKGKAMAKEGIEKIKNNKRLLAPIIGGIAAVIILIVVIVSCSGGGAKGAIKDYFEAIADCDAKKYVSLQKTDEEIKEYIKDEYDGDEDEYYAHKEKELQEIREDMEEEDIDVDDIDYEVEEIDTFTDKQIDEINKDFKEDEEDKKCTDGAFYRVKIKGAETLYFTMEKINGKWMVFGVDDDLDKGDVS